jgi:hypothetical protein
MTLVELKPDRRRDPHGRGLGELLAAIEEVERFAALRSLAFHTLAVIGVVLWIGVGFPGHLPERLRQLALAAFAAAAIAAVTALVMETRWHRIQRRRMAEQDAKVLDDGDP